MATGGGRNDGGSKLTMEIRTKSVEQTLVPLVTQVCCLFSILGPTLTVCDLFITSRPFSRLASGKRRLEVVRVKVHVDQCILRLERNYRLRGKILLIFSNDDTSPNANPERPSRRF